MAGGKNFVSYVKEAFLNRWNLLVFGGAVAAAFISGYPDVLLPVVAAGEIGYLTFLATNKRFQWIIDARTKYKKDAEQAKARQVHFQDLYDGLADGAKERFDQLRARCAVLQDIATTSHTTGLSQRDMDDIAESQLRGVNKLLWVFVKLLHTKQRLERFFHSTDESEIIAQEDEAKRRIAELESREGEDATIKQKKMASLTDSLDTARARRENLAQARQNFEYVNMELDRIAAKLAGLAEMAVNRQDPTSITQSVDDVAASVAATEEALSDLQDFAGFTIEDTGTPEILTTPEAEKKRRAKQRQTV